MNSKKRSRSIIYTNNLYLSFGKKIVKIGPVDPEIIVFRAIIKKNKLMQAKYIVALCASVPSGLNYRQHRIKLKLFLI